MQLRLFNMDRSISMKFVYRLLVVAIVLAQAIHGCNVFMKAIGTVNLSGDVEQAAGSTLRIQCVLNNSAPNVKPGSSKNIFWKKNGQTIPEKNIRIVDDYTAELIINNLTEDDGGPYLCLFNDSGKTSFVCHNYVMVASVPKNITDFSCVSVNWQYLNCSFTHPQSQVDVQYNITYMRDYYSNNTGSFSFNMPKMKGNKRNIFIINGRNSTPPYSNAAKYYSFNLTSVNAFGQNRQEFNISHYSIVKPNITSKFILDNSWNSTSLNVMMSPPVGMESFVLPLEYRIFYRSEWDLPNKWQTLNKTKNFILSNLQPNTEYNFKVQLRSPEALDDRYWSENVTSTVKTLPDVPQIPPKVSAASFQERAFLNSRNIIVFWQMIPKYMQNGPHFGYKVTASSRNGISYPEYISENHARFMDLSLEAEYEFTIQSENSKGLSLESSEIKVPNRSKIPSQVKSFTVIYYNDGVFELSWVPSKENLESVKSYTLFWCDTIKLQQFTCNGNLSWLDVDPQTTAYNITLKDEGINYHFAIASNTVAASSGMKWVTCIFPANGTLNKMKKVTVTAVAATRIKVFWALDCSEKIGVVEGFEIYYCEVAFNSTTAPCVGEQMRHFVNNMHAEGSELISLKPYTFYKVTIAAKSKAGIGEQSAALIAQTYEYVPSSAFSSVSVSDVTNTSISFTWTPPDKQNGVLELYKIYCNGQMFEQNVTGNEESMTLTELLSFTNYSVRIAACTKVGCSTEMYAFTEQTKIGVPGVMPSPDVSFYNESYVVVSFEDPVVPGGPIDAYNLLAVLVDNDGENSTQVFTNISSTYVVSTRCHEPEFHLAAYDFAVQAINYVDSEALVGPMSDFKTYHCYPKGAQPTAAIAIIGSVFGLVALVMLLIYFYFRFKQKFKEMKNITIYLPKGLETGNLKSGCDFTSIQPYQVSKKNEHDRVNGTTNPRLRNTSGDTRVSVSSMDELLHRDFKVDISSDSGSSGSSGTSLSHISSTQTTRSNLSSESNNDLGNLPPITPDGVFPDNPMNSQKILQPDLTLQVLSEASPPPNYSQFARHLNDGYLPTVASLGRSNDDGGYVLPSVPESYSQFGSALQNPGYMNVIQRDAAEATDPYSQLGITSDPPSQPGVVYSTLGRIDEPMTSERNQQWANPGGNSGYVAPSMADFGNQPREKCDASEPKVDETTVPLPVAYSRLSFHDPNASRPSKGYVALPDFNSLVTRQHQPSDAEVASTSKDYVPLDTVEEMDATTTTTDAMKSSLTSDEAMKSSMTSTDGMKTSVTSNDEAMKSSMTSEEAMKMSLASDDAMKSSLTSDGYDSPGPYSRVASMTFDESDACKES